jgi:3-deoxy-7-phosphoheptulonate synthase
MIILMKKDSSLSDLARVINQVEEMGFSPRPYHGALRTVIGVMDGLAEALEPVKELPGVESVSPLSSKFKLVSRDFQPEPTVVRLGKLQIGATGFVVMAGPCAVENRDQLLSTARAVAGSGGHILRGGAFKPRTSPYSFQGLKEEGLQILADARQETGLPVITEVISPETVPLVARYADILQIGSRNMQNYALLDAVGKARVPVMLKRGLMSTIEEMLLAAEYLMSNGNSQVILCERGIRTYEKVTRNTLDLSAVPVIKQKSHLPVIVDPSHAVGVVDYVPSMALAAVASGADGIMVETHPDPANALSDGPQSLTFAGFAELMQKVGAVAEAVGRPLASPTRPDQAALKRS